ncbi:Uncharacterized protein PODLI_1B035296, partial [Podarcis lilfordi]
FFMEIPLFQRHFLLLPAAILNCAEISRDHKRLFMYVTSAARMLLAQRWREDELAECWELDLEQEEFKIVRAFRLGRGGKKEKNRIRDCLITLRSKEERDRILGWHYQKTLVIQQSRVEIFKDIPKHLLDLRSNYGDLVVLLRRNKLIFRWEFPQGPSFSFKGRKIKIRSVEDKAKFLNNYEEDLQKELGKELRALDRRSPDRGLEQRALDRRSPKRGIVDIATLPFGLDRLVTPTLPTEEEQALGAMTKEDLSQLKFNHNAVKMEMKLTPTGSFRWRMNDTLFRNEEVTKKTQKTLRDYFEINMNTTIEKRNAIKKRVQNEKKDKILEKIKEGEKKLRAKPKSQEILKEIKLYHETQKEMDIDRFLKTNGLQKISQENKLMLNYKITEQEVEGAIQNMQLGKSPGPDESEKTQLKNYRPISLLNEPESSTKRVLELIQEFEFVQVHKPLSVTEPLRHGSSISGEEWVFLQELSSSPLLVPSSAAESLPTCVSPFTSLPSDGSSLTSTSPPGPLSPPLAPSTGESISLSPSELSFMWLGCRAVEKLTSTCSKLMSFLQNLEAKALCSSSNARSASSVQTNFFLLLRQSVMGAAIPQEFHLLEYTNTSSKKATQFLSSFVKIFPFRTLVKMSSILGIGKATGSDTAFKALKFLSMNSLSSCISLSDMAYSLPTGSCAPGIPARPTSGSCNASQLIPNIMGAPPKVATLNAITPCHRSWSPAGGCLKGSSSATSITRAGLGGSGVGTLTALWPGCCAPTLLPSLAIPSSGGRLWQSDLAVGRDSISGRVVLLLSPHWALKLRARAVPISIGSAGWKPKKALLQRAFEWVPPISPTPICEPA